MADSEPPSGAAARAGRRNPHGLPEPPGWPSSFWPGFLVTAASTAAFIVAGLVVASGVGSVLVGIILLTFGLAAGAFLPLTWPVPPPERMWKVTVNTVSGPERGLGFPYSVFRNSMTVVGSALITLACLELVLLEGDPGSYPPVFVVRVAGVVGALGFGLLTVIGLQRVAGRQATAVLTPTSVAYVRGSSVLSVPWEAIENVGIGPLQGQWFVTISADESRVSFDGPGSWLDRLSSRSNHRRGADISFPRRVLAGSLLLLLYATSYYLRNPDARAELGTDAAIGRVRRADVVQTESEPQAGTESGPEETSS